MAVSRENATALEGFAAVARVHRRDLFCSGGCGRRPASAAAFHGSAPHRGRELEDRRLCVFWRRRLGDLVSPYREARNTQARVDHSKWPNQSLEPTPTSVMPAAEQPARRP